MTIQYKFIPEQHYVLTAVAGLIEATDVLEHFDRLINDMSLSSPFIEVVDFSHAINFDFGYLQTWPMAIKLEHLKCLGNYEGSILIADRDLIRGMANIFKVASERKTIEVRIVSSFEEALNEVSDHFAE